MEPFFASDEHCSISNEETEGIKLTHLFLIEVNRFFRVEGDSGLGWAWISRVKQKWVLYEFNAKKFLGALENEFFN